MRALRAAIEPLDLQHAVHFVDIGKCAALGLRPLLGKRCRVGAAAFETGAMTGSKRRDFVEKEQVRVAVPPDLVPPSLERQHATDPLPRGPAPFAQCLVVAMKAPAAIAVQRAARRRGDQLAEWRDAVL